MVGSVLFVQIKIPNAIACLCGGKTPLFTVYVYGKNICLVRKFGDNRRFTGIVPFMIEYVYAEQSRVSVHAGSYILP